MAEREVRIRVSLASGAFVSGIQGMERASKDAARRSGGAWSEALNSGLKAGGASMRGMLSSLTGHLRTAATLGGALTFGGLVKSSVELSDRLGEIAFNIEKSTGAAMTWRELHEDLSKTAEATGRRTQELAEAFDSVFKATGKADVAKAAIDPIGRIATATGADVLQLADAASVLTRKFGASAETLPQMLTQFIEKTGAGGLSLDTLGRKFGLMAGEASEAGFKGAEGVSSLLGILQRLNDRVGEGADVGLKKLFQTLKEGSAGLKALEKASGIKFAPDTTAFEKIDKLLEGRGRKAIEAKLTGESRAVFDELVGGFDRAFAAAKKEGKSTKEAIEIGRQAFRVGLADAGKSTLTYQKIVEKSASELGDPAEQLNLAIEKLQSAMLNPKIFDALNEMAQHAPAAAEALAKVVSFIGRHPILSGGTFLAGKAALPAAGAMMGNLFSGGGGGGAAEGLQKVGSTSGSATSGLTKVAQEAVKVAGTLGLVASGMIALVGTIQALKEEAEFREMERTKSRGETLQRALASGRIKAEDLDASQRAAIQEATALQDLGGPEGPGAFDELQKMKRRRAEQRGTAAMLGIEESLFGPAGATGSAAAVPFMEPPKEMDVKNADAVGAAVGKGLSGQTLNVRVTNASELGGGMVGGGGSEGTASKGPGGSPFALQIVPMGGATPHGG